MNYATLGKINKYIDDIKYCIANFDVDPTNYVALTPSAAGTKGDESNIIYTADGKMPANFVVSFGENAKNCRIFIGKDVTCRGSRVVMTHGDSLLFIGNGTSLINVTMHIWCKWDFVIVGEGVSVTSTSNWTTGINAGDPCNGLIVGDHCLMASEIAIRPADGHQIIDLETRKTINRATAPIVIEPYCWIGQRVGILKNVRIGACSIIALGAVVTKSCPTFSALSGVPAKARSIEGKMWLRNNGEVAKKAMELYEERFAGKRRARSRTFSESIRSV